MTKSNGNISLQWRHMDTIASLITSLTVVYSIVYSDADQRKHQSSASLAFVWGILRGPLNSPQKWPVTRKMFPFDDVIMFRVTGLMCREFTCDQYKGQWCGNLMFSLICTWTNGWVNNRHASDLRRHRAHYDVIVMLWEKRMVGFIKIK